MCIRDSINVTYGVSEPLTLCGITSSSASLQHSLTSTFTNFAGMASPATHCKFTFPICSTFMPCSNSSLITGTSAPESISALTFIGSFPAASHSPTEFPSEYQVKGDISSLTLLQFLQNYETDVLWLDFLNYQPLEFDSPSNFLVLHHNLRL